MFKPYIYGAVLLALSVSIGGSYLKGRSDEKASIMSQLASDKIQILQDGKEVDNEVLNSNDTALCILLGGCD